MILYADTLKELKGYGVPFEMIIHLAIFL